jgi:hypothetical protein
MHYLIPLLEISAVESPFLAGVVLLAIVEENIIARLQALHVQAESTG